MSKIKIALDAMGGDNSPSEIVSGSILSLENKKIEIILVGKEELIRQELLKHEYDKSRIKIVNATEIIANDDIPTQAIKEKKDSSIVVGLKLVKNGDADGFVSAGSTGALLAGATFIVGRIKGIERPALATLLPNKKNFSLLVDCGANVDAKPTYLAQYAKMGSAYMESVMGIKNPKVGLINIGTEDEKGNILTKEAFPLLKECGVNFVGNVEPRELPMGIVDVMVCDAFVGNVVLKYSEGFALAILSMIKKELMAKPLYKIGALLSKGAFKNLKKSFSYEEYGGAPFLGLKALVVKAHGSSNAVAINGAINQCFLASENNLVEKIINNL